MSEKKAIYDFGATTQDEATEIWMRAPKRHMPKFLAEVWWVRNDPNPSVEKFIAALRAGAQSPELDDPKAAPAHVARLIAGLLQSFERLVEKGKLDEVLPDLPGLPLLYSPHAGKGAGEWERAASLYGAKRVGVDCMQEYRGSESSRSALWRNLAYDTVSVIQSAALRMPEFHALKKAATPHFIISKKVSQEAQLVFGADVFLLPGGELLVWPDWLDLCHAIPRREEGGLLARIKDARQAYLEAAKAVLNNFFADPDNPHAEEIVAAVRTASGLQGAAALTVAATSNGRKLHRAQAVAEARKNVLDTIGRM